MIDEFNNQHHQHQGTSRGWCAWLIVNLIPSSMIESSGNVPIPKSKKFLSLLNSKWDHPETINGNVKNWIKRIEYEI